MRGEAIQVNMIDHLFVGHIEIVFVLVIYNTYKKNGKMGVLKTSFFMRLIMI
jgi:hypothetical protein